MIVCFAVAAVGLVSFVGIELRTAKPLVDVAIFRNKMLSAAMIALILSHMLHNPIALAAPLYLQNVLGASAVAAGLLLAVLPLSTALASPLSGRLADRFDASSVATIGIGLIVAGIACYACLGCRFPFRVDRRGLGLARRRYRYFYAGQSEACLRCSRQGGLRRAGGHAQLLRHRRWHDRHDDSGGTDGDAGGDEIWKSQAVFAGAQQFAFACLVPIGLVAIVVAKRARSRNGEII